MKLRKSEFTAILLLASLGTVPLLLGLLSVERIPNFYIVIPFIGIAISFAMGVMKSGPTITHTTTENKESVEEAFDQNEEPESKTLGIRSLAVLGLITVALFLVVNSGNNSSFGAASAKDCTGPGDASCMGMVEMRLQDISAGGEAYMGPIYIGNGIFEGLVANETTNYKYKKVAIETNCNCEIINATAF